MTAGDLPDLLPARMLNEYAYCPRLGYLMWAEGEFADNKFTLDGKHVHRNVDADDDPLPDPTAADGNKVLPPGRPDPADAAAPRATRSVMLSAPREGFIAVIDLVETEGGAAVPVDYKRGKKPDIPEGAYEPERVQLGAQALILRENGYACDRGMVYFAGSRDRVEIPITDELVARTRELAAAFVSSAGGDIPPPLFDSPKCNGCSLVGICLPDETAMLKDQATVKAGEPEVRRLIPARDDALPMYVQAQGAFVGKSGDVLVVKEKGEKVAEAKLYETSQLGVFGNVQISTQVIHELCQRGIPVCYHTTGGWFCGMTVGSFHKNVDLRRAQFRTAFDGGRSLALARRFVAGKIANCRTMLRRNAEGIAGDLLARLKTFQDEAAEAASAQSLLGIEGSAARLYFEGFPHMIGDAAMRDGFSFEGRNRRPPKDPVNALLSLAYTLLVKDLTVIATAAGFDPYQGFYHAPRYGRPSLALDLMEEFRPIVADSTVIGAINTGVVGVSDFVSTGRGAALKPEARKKFITAFERRMDQLVTHPVFGYKISYRRVLDVQVRLLGRHLKGEIPEYPAFTTR